MAVACLNYLESHIPYSKIGWFPRGNPVRSLAPFAPDPGGQSAYLGSGIRRQSWQHQFLLSGLGGKGLDQDAEFQAEQEQATLRLFAYFDRGGREVEIDGGISEAESCGV